MVEPDVTKFYISFIGVFLIVITLVTLLVAVLVKCLITDPINKLSQKIEKNDIDVAEIKTRDR